MSDLVSGTVRASKPEGALSADKMPDSVLTSLGGVHERITILSEALDALVARIGPVLVPEPPQTSEDKRSSLALEGNESALRTEMMEMERRLEYLTDLVRTTLHRADF